MEQWIVENWEKAVPILISSMSALISAIAVTVAIFNSIKTQKQIRASKKPALSMRLDNFSSVLHLTVENTGAVAATNISIFETAVENNGSETKSGVHVPLIDNLQLYPKEVSQVEFGFCPESIVTGRLFPTLHIDVLYQFDGNKKSVNYSRSVKLSRQWDSRVLADVNVDLSKIEKSLYTAAKATLRTANYLDGHLLFHFDDLNIATKRNLHDDMCDAFREQKEKGIIDRETTIREALSLQGKEELGDE